MEGTNFIEMKTQEKKYKYLGDLLLAMGVIVFSGILMAPTCREERYYDDENYADEGEAVYSPPPAWAPAYTNVNVVRYYYFPDYYIYYDVWTAQYVYWDGFGWVYAVSYPAFIGPFNPYGAYIVVLDYHVHHPWRNHTYYVNHYPQYYYQNNYYGHRDNSVIRGYDENGGKAVYVSRESKQGREMLKKSGDRNIQDRNVPSLDKNSQQPSFDKKQERTREQLEKKQQPDYRSKPDQREEMNRQKKFNDQRNFERPEQKREAPSNFQKQQDRHQSTPPMQKSSPGGGGNKPEKRGGGKMP